MLTLDEFLQISRPVMSLLSLLTLLAKKFLSDANKGRARKINLQKLAILEKVGHFATPLPFFVGPRNLFHFL